MGALIRAATHTDLDALHALIERAYRSDAARATWTHEVEIIGGPRTSRAYLAGSIDDPDRRLMVADDGDRLIGCVEISDKGGGLAYLGLLTVEPTLQQGGLGKRLLTEAEAVAQRDFGTTRLEMTVIALRETLIAYYQRRGYAITHETRPFPAIEDVIFFSEQPPAMTVLEKAL